MLNIRRIPLDNWANAFCKRAMDVAGCAAGGDVPHHAAAAIGVKLLPGPVIFRQKRIGRKKKPFNMNISASCG